MKEPLRQLIDILDGAEYMSSTVHRPRETRERRHSPNGDGVWE